MTACIMVALLAFIICYGVLLLVATDDVDLTQRLQVRLEAKYVAYTKQTKKLMRYWVSRTHDRDSNPAVELLRLHEYISITEYLTSMAEAKYFNSPNFTRETLLKSELEEVRTTLAEAKNFIVTFPKVYPSRLEKQKASNVNITSI